MNVLLGTLAAVLGYLLGSVSFSVLLSKRHFHTDVRTQGSGNAGATNVARVFGMRAGVVTLLCDMAKTAAAMGVGQLLCGDVGLALAGGACLIGHCWPVFFGFRGGKGVSVGAAIGLLIDWRVLLIIVAVFALGMLLTRIVSVGSMLAAFALPIASLIVGVSVPKLVLAIFTGALVIFMHRANIGRLLRHEEAPFHPKK